MCVCAFVLRRAAQAEAQSERKAHAQFSLGGALVGLPAAPGHARPQLHAPGSWLRLFKQHAGPDLYNGLFRSCRKGRDWVLQDASEAALLLDTRVKQSRRAWDRQLRAVRRDLQTRGSLPTFPVFAIIPWPGTFGVRSQIYKALQGACGGVKQLFLFIVPERPCARKGLLGRAAAAIAARLRRRPANPPVSSLWPQPAHLPSVTKLDIRDSIGSVRLPDNVLAHLATFNPQLTTLRVQQPTYTGLWPVVFSPATTSRTLVCLRTDGMLTDELLGLLLEHAPALTDLWVLSVDVKSDGYREREWVLRALKIRQGDVQLGELRGLPRSTQERGQVGMPQIRGLETCVYLHDDLLDPVRSSWNTRMQV